MRINGASLAGPALAGALYGLHHVAPFTFTAAAFFLALTATAFLPTGFARPASHEEPADGGMLAGLRELWGQPVLRAAVMTLIALGMPVGLAGCGLLLQYLPARAAMLTLAAAMAVVTAYGLSRPELRHARWPRANR